MTSTKGRIEREGKIHFQDASLSIWEEGLLSARDAKGHAGAMDWERQFKRDVFARVVQTLRRMGWVTKVGTHIYTGNNARYCAKGDLHADLKISGRVIELDFFQDVNAPDRPDHGGRYQREKERHMPYLLRLEMERTRRRIRKYLLNVFTGYRFEPPKPTIGLSGVTALEWIEAGWRASCHYNKDLGRVSGEDSPYNNKSADRAIVRHGAHVWSTDHKGRIIAGTAYYHINNMWWVVTGKFGLLNKSSREIYTQQPEDLRTKCNARSRRNRLEKELSLAVGRMDFQRAQTLKSILFGNEQTFQIWARDKNAYYRSQYTGYTLDRISA